MEPARYFAQLERANRGARKRDVVVLGAGMAGLVAGYELSRLGHRVRVFEASERVGGRVYTKRLADRGQLLFAELGAMRIPREHLFTRHYVGVSGLQDKLTKFYTALENEHCFLEANGRRCRVRDAVCGPPALPIPNARSPYTEPFLTVLKILVDAVSPGEVRTGFAADLESGVVPMLDDRLAKEDFFCEPAKLTPNQVVQRLAQLRELWSEPVAIFMRDIALETSSELEQISGGMTQLPEALAAILNGKVQLNHAATHIAQNAAGVKVEFANGCEVHADNVLCTIPFPVLRELKLSGFSAAKQEVIRSVIYLNACKVFLVCRERFWERERYGIFGGASASDQPFRQVYYPTPMQGLTRGVLLASYAIGLDARTTAAMPPEQVGQMLLPMHPELDEPGMVEEAFSFSWEDHVWTRGGCSVTYIGSTASQQKLHAEVVRPEGAVHFAGEHCSDDRAWIEGAITSSLLQVLALVQRKD